MRFGTWRIWASQQENSRGQGTAKVEQGSAKAKEGEGEE
jgi:hypothetical protein